MIKFSRCAIANSFYTSETYIDSINESFRTSKSNTINSFDCSIGANGFLLPLISWIIDKRIPFNNANFELGISGSLLQKD